MAGFDQFGLFVFLAGHAWLVLIIPVESMAHVFSANSKIFSLASATLNLHVVWIASAFAQ
jgi:hypothetical protein